MCKKGDIPQIGRKYELFFIGGTLLSPYVKWVKGTCVEVSDPPMLMGHIFVLEDGKRVMKYSGDIRPIVE